MSDVNRTVSYTFKGSTRRLQRSIRNLNDKMQSLGSRAQEIGQTMSTYVTAPIAAAGAAAIKFAADAETVQQKTNAVFGSMAGEVTSWSDNVSNELGVSSNQMQSFATNVADMLIPMGIAQDEAVGMSQDVSVLAQDLAAFNSDISSEEAIERLQSGLRGSSDAVDVFGTNIRAAAVEQELMNQGMADSLSNATEQEKMMARLAIITRETSAAHGAAKRNLNTFSGQMQRVTSSARDLLAEMGDKLLPVARAMATIFGNLIERFQGFSDSTQTLIAVIAGLVAGIGPLLAGLGFFTSTIIPAIISGFGAIATAAAAAWAAITSPVGIVVAAVAAVGSVAYLIISNWEDVKTFFSDFFSGIVDTLSGVATGLIMRFQEASEGIKAAILGALESVLSSALGFFESMGLDALMGPIENAVNSIGSQAERAAERSEQAGQRAREGFNQMSEGMTSAASTVTNAAGQMMDNVIDRVESTKDSISGLFSSPERGSAMTQNSNDFNNTNTNSGENQPQNGNEEQSQLNLIEGAPQQQRQTNELYSATTDQIKRVSEAEAQRANRIRQMREQMRLFNVLQKEVLSTMRDSVMQVGTAFGESFTGAIFEGKNAFKEFGKAALGILQDLIAQLISAVAQAILLNTLTGGLGGVGGLTGAIGGVLGFAKGGIVTKPTLGIIGEGTESEAVMPLSQLDSMMQSSGGGGNVTITPQVLPSGDLTFAQREGNRRRNRLGQS